MEYINIYSLLNNYFSGCLSLLIQTSHHWSQLAQLPFISLFCVLFICLLDQSVVIWKMAHVSVKNSCFLVQKSLLCWYHAQSFVTVQSVVPSLAHLVYWSKFHQSLWLLSISSFCDSQGVFEWLDRLWKFVLMFLAVSKLHVWAIHQKVAFRRFYLSFLDRLKEIFFSCVIDSGLSIQSAKIVEKVGAVNLGKERVYFECLGIVVETHSFLIKVGIATAKIVELLSLLFDLFFLEPFAEVLNGFFVIFHPVVAVSNIETSIMINFAIRSVLLQRTG